MDEFVSRVTVLINGQNIANFKGYSEDERELRRRVNLMNKTGFSKVTTRYGFSLDYVVPTSGAEFDFDSVENGTAVVELEGGQRVVYSGVCTLRVGESTVDGENEMVRPVSFGAEARRVE